ncbi:MAG: Stf0 family sulfotransferase [Marivibrio sp.]|uniref:Stf0 family sulfotransferase n=1 Tax=Marivibrio sp. TaxID=2039719 RepID=UPI0032EB1C11
MLVDSYILCTAPRSGSTLLCRMLAQTGVAGRPDSYFHEPSLEGWLADWGMSADPAETEQETLARVFARAVEEGRGGTGIFGLRLQRRSADFFFEKLALLYPEATGDMSRLAAAFGRVGFLYLRRADKVAQAVSFVKAEQSGLWHRAADGSELERLAPPQAPAYDAERLSAEVARLAAYDAAWETWFARAGIAPLRLTYEALAANPRETLRAALEHLGLDPAAAEGATPDVARLADATSEAWAVRFRREAGLA